jgi:hypothetical protein
MHHNTNTTINNITSGLNNTPPPYHDLAVTHPPTSIADVAQQPHSQTDPFIDERLGLIIFLVSTITSIALVLVMVVREYYFKRYGVDVCPLFASNSAQERDAMDRRRRADSEQHNADWALAEQLQRQLNEEGREAERITKRKERRKWYEYSLKSRCMVSDMDVLPTNPDLFIIVACHNSQRYNSFPQTVQSSDLFYAHETQGDVDENDKSMSLSVKLRCASTELSDDEENEKIYQVERTPSFEEEEVLENARDSPAAAAREEEHSTSDAAPVLCGRNEEDAHRYLKLPVRNDVGMYRHVDGQCALCIDDYEIGDFVVWSDLHCTHAFHKECIMQWLSKGKKRCPICRNWFVPGARIEDQKKLHGEEWVRANAELTRIEDEQIVRDAQDLENGRGDNTGDELRPSQDTDVMPSNAVEGPETIHLRDVASAPCDFNCLAVTSCLHSSSQNVQNEQRPKQLSDGSTRIDTNETIDACTSSETIIADDYYGTDILMNVSTETEEDTEFVRASDQV